MLNGRPIYILSDLHLDNPECDYEGINTMFDRAESENAWFVTAGDILDCWYGDVEVLVGQYQEQLDRMQQRLIFSVVGNHDSPILHRDPVLSPSFYPDKALCLDNDIWYVEHGHLVGKYGWLFEILDRFDEEKWFRKLARWFVKRRFLGSSGRDYYGTKFRDEVMAQGRKYGAAIVIAGHTHVQEIYRDSTGPVDVIYVNPGSGLGRLTYVIYRDGKFYREGTPS